MSSSAVFRGGSSSLLNNNQREVFLSGRLVRAVRIDGGERGLSTLTHLNRCGIVSRHGCGVKIIDAARVWGTPCRSLSSAVTIARVFSEQRRQENGIYCCALIANDRAVRSEDVDAAVEGTIHHPHSEQEIPQQASATTADSLVNLHFHVRNDGSNGEQTEELNNGARLSLEDGIQPNPDYKKNDFEEEITENGTDFGRTEFLHQILQGDTAGAALLLEGVNVSAGDRDLIVDGDLRVMPGDRVGIVGPNGCGKSSLLRALLGQQSLESGRVSVAHGTQCGYLEQTAISGSTRTVWEEVRSRMTRVNAAVDELQLAEAALTRNEPGADARLALAQDELLAADGYRVNETIAGVLNGLGFAQSDWSRSCSEFSGGWQMRIALARLLLGQAGMFERSLLLLDEPTNHLDRNARVWLAEFLKRTGATVMVVSHDEELLDRVCGRIAEIRGGRLIHYMGNYSNFVREREARQLQLEKEIESRQQEIGRLQGFVDRFGAKATKAAAANSRKKMIAKLQEKLPDPPPEGNEGGAKMAAVIRLPPPPPCVREALVLRKAVIGWEGCEPLMRNVDVNLQLGMRLVILGVNGCGKSTLLRALAGRGGLLDGVRDVGDGVKLGVFTQDLAQDLPADVSSLQYVLEIARERDPNITNEAARSCLGALGLTGPKALRPIGALSGGEKARAALAAFVLRPCNVLLLDEASNHLDSGTVDALAAAVRHFKGAVVAISHNREFCEALGPTHVARVLPDGTVDIRICVFGELRPEDFDPEAAQKERDARLKARPRGLGPAAETKAPVTPPQGAAQAAADERKAQETSAFQLRKKTQQMQSRIKKLMAGLEEGEALLGKCDRAMLEAGSDTAKVLAILKKKEVAQAKMAEWESEWETLEEELAKLDNTLKLTNS